MKTTEIISFTKKWHSELNSFIIGPASSLTFAKAGATYVTFIGRHTEKLREAAAIIAEASVDEKAKAVFEAADLTDKDQVERAFQSVVEKVGRVDITVSNVTGYSPTLL
ncbi:hypothetical protein VUR80DRAFT_1145 [Thermomyces stellatus]